MKAWQLAVSKLFVSNSFGEANCLVLQITQTSLEKIISFVSHNSELLLESITLVLIVYCRWLLLVFFVSLFCLLFDLLLLITPSAVDCCFTCPRSFVTEGRIVSLARSVSVHVGTRLTLYQLQFQTVTFPGYELQPFCSSPHRNVNVVVVYVHGSRLFEKFQRFVFYVFVDHALRIFV
jgi:hypothetical protein